MEKILIEAVTTSVGAGAGPAAHQPDAHAQHTLLIRPPQRAIDLAAPRLLPTPSLTRRVALASPAALMARPAVTRLELLKCRVTVPSMVIVAANAVK